MLQPIANSKNQMALGSPSNNVYILYYKLYTKKYQKNKSFKKMFYRKISTKIKNVYFYDKYIS